MKIWYKVTGHFSNSEPKTIELTATGTSQTRLHDLPIKSALEEMSKSGTLEKYEVAIVSTSLEDA
jgi:hypothetical protein